jgi:hypothetical protein
VYFMSTEVVDPDLVSDCGPLEGQRQGPGIIADVLLEAGAALGAGKSYLFRFDVEVTVPEDPAGERVSIDFKDGLVGDRGCWLPMWNFLSEFSWFPFWNVFQVSRRGCSFTVKPGALFIRGDSNDDGKTDISDAVFTLSWLFLGGKAPGCRAALNVNGDRVVDISDPVSLLSHLFLGGAPPAAPYPGCGAGELPEDETLGCATPPESCQ